MIDETKMERRTIEAGTILNMNGIPIEVCEPFEAATHPNNWTIALEPPPERDGLVDAASSIGNA